MQTGGKDRKDKWTARKTIEKVRKSAVTSASRN